jgi:hypothetical protein
MERDPTTGEAIPATAIQRVLFLAPSVHIYRIPPITSSRGFNAAAWTANPADHIFTARIRLIETAIPPENDSDNEKITANILLEDPSTMQLFAAAPYNHPSAVEQALDSSRFFAIRVVGEKGMKATLGMGFEQRPEAFEFVVSLQDVRRTLGLEPSAVGSAAGSFGIKRGIPGKGASAQKDEELKRDLSLKDGEMITINIGGRSKKATTGSTPEKSGGLNAFAILPPPPSAATVKAGRQAESSSSSAPAPAPAAFIAPPPSTSKQNLSDMGFDDGEFGEFQ